MRKGFRKVPRTQICVQWQLDTPDASVMYRDKYIPFRTDSEESWEEDTGHAAFLV